MHVLPFDWLDITWCSVRLFDPTGHGITVGCVSLVKIEKKYCSQDFGHGMTVGCVSLVKIHTFIVHRTLDLLPTFFE